MHDLFSIEPLSFIALIVATICGFVIGFERQVFGKPAGIRTSSPVCTGAYTFIAIANYYQPDEGSVRVLGNLVTGVGFLGAGMMLSKDGSITGVTSAATIWMLAAIGSLIGFGNYKAAISITFFTLFILIGISILERSFKKLRRGVHKILKEDEEDEK
jgi:putative Mg2+ transporter-C (MgtC) family protein